MKRTISGLIALLLAFILAGCSLPRLPWLSRSSDQGVDGSALAVYRLSADTAHSGGLIEPETFPMPAADGTELETAARLFASPAGASGLISALPSDIGILSVTGENGVATITFSEAFLALPEIRRTTIAFCAVMTFCQLDGIEAVNIAAGDEILYAGLTPEDAFLTAEAGDPYIRRLRLYFCDADGRYLISEYHSLTLEENASAERYVVEELLRGPNNGELTSAIPAGTRLISCATANGVCTVDLSAEFYDNRPSTALGERLAIYSIVDSLTALSAVKSVRFLVEGAPVDTYVYVSLAEPFSRYEAPIGPVSAPRNELDADLCLVLPGMDGLAPLPFRIDTAGYDTQAEAVLAGLFSAAEPGYPAPFQASAYITSVSLSGTRCTLELSEGFLASIPEDVRAVVLGSITDTLCALSGITSVRFDVGGSPAVIDGTDWSGPWRGAGEIIQTKEVN